MWLEWLEFAVDCFESLSNGSELHSNGSNLHSIGSNLFRMFRISIRMLRIVFEWFEFGFKCFESLSNHSNLNSNASNPFRMVRICIRMLQIPFEWFEFGFESDRWVGKWVSGQVASRQLVSSNHTLSVTIPTGSPTRRVWQLWCVYQWREARVLIPTLQASCSGGTCQPGLAS